MKTIIPLETLKNIGVGISLGLALQLVSPASAQTLQPVRKKLIAAGWDRPNAATLRKNLKIMEKTPYDGVIIKIEGRDDNNKYVTASRNNFSDKPLKKEWFQKSIDDLKAVHSARLTDNFIQTSANPGNVDWFDDKGWKQIIENYRIVALIAKEGGLKGIHFDPEPYTEPYRQFTYAFQAQHGEHSFKEYQDKVRQRGREMIEAIASVDPNLLIFTYLMNSVNAAAANSPYPEAALKYAQYGLYPAFINGWLDAAPPTMKFVDGCELQGYKANDEMTFLKTADIVRNTALNLVAPENRGKYLSQVQTSFGIYLDAYLNPPTSRWYIDPKGATPTQRLKTNIAFAADASSEYVWTWGEKYRWWPVTGKDAEAQVSAEYWHEVLPGINEALESVFKPATQDLQQKIASLLEDERKINLIENGDFSLPAEDSAPLKDARADWSTQGAPAGWSIWQHKTSKGTFTQDAGVNHSGRTGGSIRISGVRNGSLIQSVAVKPGESYLIRGWVRQEGEGTGFIWVRWQHDGKFVDSSSSDSLMTGTPNAERGSWRSIEGVTTAPAGASRLVVLLVAMKQASKEESIWYDDIQLYRVP